MHPANPPKSLVVSAGEPAGIGPDICLQIAREPREFALIVIADPEQLQLRARQLALPLDIELYDPNFEAAAGSFQILPITLADKTVCGEPSPANAQSLLDGLARAVDGCRNGEFSALVTGPLQKSTINDAGISFSGHTEFIAEQCNIAKPVMMLIAEQLRIALVSTHMPLREVPDYITEDRVYETLSVVHHDLTNKFAIANPEIIVCGLNPHAGEGGHLGTEDDAIIRPAIEKMRADGYNVRGPLPADTAFTPAAGHADAVVAMYHDQGLPVLKHAGFGRAINVTLGLPIIRTSVDHGTALDIAGSGHADAGSMRAAIDLADRLAAP